MSNEVAENLREIASNLLAAANRLDGIDVSTDAMRNGTVKPERVPVFPDPMVELAAWDRAVDASKRDVPPEPEAVNVKVMTGRGFGVYVHRDPISPLQIGDCPWPDGPCAGHRTGLGGMPLLTVPDDQAMYVPHRHAPARDLPGITCSEIVCHETHARPCRYCGGAPCRITPLERGA